MLQKLICRVQYTNSVVGFRVDFSAAFISLLVVGLPAHGGHVRIMSKRDRQTGGSDITIMNPVPARGVRVY